MKKLEQVSDECWNKINPLNQSILNDFIKNSVELSPQTRKIYFSNLRIWFKWVYDNLDNKSHIDIKPLEYKRFQNWIINRGCSSSDVNNKRAAVSSLNGYLEIYYCDEYPSFRNFINKSIKRPPKAFVHEKEPLNSEEFEHLIEVLKEREDWQKIAYLMFTFDTGCRRAESQQVLKNIVEAKPIYKTKTVEHDDGTQEEKQIIMYQTHPIRCKGAGTQGKIRRLTFGENTMNSFKKWLAVRGEDDCPYMFVTNYGGEVHQVSVTCFNAWANNTFEQIVGRRVHPHIFRESRATQAVVENGKDIESVRVLLGHESSDTTRIYVIRDDSNDVDDLF